MLNFRRYFLLLSLAICAASSALAYPIAYTINVTFSDIPGQVDPLDLAGETASITTTLESVAAPAPGGTYNATVLLSLAGANPITNTGTITINTNGTITANFSSTVGSFSANVVLPGITFPSPIPLAFGTVSISSPASTVMYDAFDLTGEVGITGTISALGLSATPATVSASYMSGGAAPAPQTITVNDSSGATGFTASVGAGSNGSSTSFLTVSPTSGSTPGPVTLTFSTSVAAGTYTASVLLNTSSDTSGAPLSIPVTYTVSGSSGTPQLQLSQQSLTFTFYAPTSTGSNTMTTTLNVSVPSGSSNVAYTASVVSGAFLSISPTSGNTPGSITVTANDTGLAVGSYSGSILITAPGYSNVTVPVTLTVNSSSGGGGGGSTSGITLSPSSLTFNVVAGGSVSPSSVQVTTPTPVAFTVSGVDFYLPVSPSAGTTNATITIGVNAAGLTNGTYSDNIVITAGGKTATLPVTVFVGPTTDISLNVFSANLTSPGTLSQAITVSSDTTTQFGYTLTTSAPWITVTPSSGSSPSTFTITAVPNGLPAGISTGTVTITAPNVRNSPQTIHVTLNVAQTTPVTITATPSVVLFEQAVAGAPVTQTVQLAVGSSTPTYMVTPIGSPWLTASLNASTGVVSLSADPTGLLAGTYSGSVEVASSGISNSPYYLPVTLVVGTAVSAAPAALNFGGPAGGASPATQTIAIANAASGATAASDSPWLTVTQPAPNVTATVNTTGLAAGTYNGNITITSGTAPGTSQITIPVTLTVGSPATPVIAAVTSAISYVPGAAAPGSIVSIFGTNLTSGTAGGNTVQTTSNSFGSLLSGVEAFADGIPCPILYASAGQVNIVLPFEISGQTSADIYLNAYGVASNVLTIPIQPVAPALFSATANGTGAGAILNPDLSLNTQPNPAPAGAEVALFGGGAGITSPFAMDGQIIPTTTPFPTLAAAVTATVGGLPATVDYAGDAPGLVAGVLQVNITIPAGTPSGAQPVVVTVGGVSSQSGLTVFVQ